MKKTILIISMSCLISCTNYTENGESLIRNKLTNNGEKFWDVHQHFDRKFPNSPVYCYSFKSDGTYQKFYYESETDKRKIYDAFEDVIVPNTWEIVSDSYILIGDTELEFERLTKDTLILKTQAGDRIAMHASSK
jgi:hypothetical protein